MRTILVILAIAAASATAQQERYAYATLQSNTIPLVILGDLRFVQYSPGTPIRAFGHFVDFENDLYEIYVHEISNLQPDCSSTGSSHQFVDNEFGKVTAFFLDDQGINKTIAKECSAQISIEPNTSNSIIERPIVVHNYDHRNLKQMKLDGTHVNSVACGIVKSHNKDRYNDTYAYVRMESNSEPGTYLGYLRFQHSAPDVPVVVFGDLVHLESGLYQIFLNKQANMTEKCVSTGPVVDNYHTMPFIVRFRGYRGSISRITDTSKALISIGLNTPNNIIGSSMTIRRIPDRLTDMEILDVNTSNIACGVVMSGHVSIPTVAPTTRSTTPFISTSMEYTTAAPRTSQQVRYAHAALMSNKALRIHVGDLHFVQYSPDTSVQVFGDIVGLEYDVYDIFTYDQSNLDEQCKKTAAAVDRDDRRAITSFTSDEGNITWINHECMRTISLVPNTSDTIIDRAIALGFSWYIHNPKLPMNGSHVSNVVCGVVLSGRAEHQKLYAHAKMRKIGSSDDLGTLRFQQSDTNSTVQIFGNLIGLNKSEAYKIVFTDERNSSGQCFFNTGGPEYERSDAETYIMIEFYGAEGKTSVNKSWRSMLNTLGTAGSIIGRAITIRTFINDYNVACGVVLSGIPKNPKTYAHAKMRTIGSSNNDLGNLHFQRSDPKSQVRVYGYLVGLTNSNLYLIFYTDERNPSGQCFLNTTGPKYQPRDANTISITQFRGDEGKTSVDRWMWPSLLNARGTEDSVIGRAIVIRSLDNNTNIACGVVDHTEKNGVSDTEIYLLLSSGRKIVNFASEDMTTLAPVCMEERMLIAVRRIVPAMSTTKYKGQDGIIGIFGGSNEYTGAPYFAAMSALRTGADLVHIFCSKDAGTAVKSMNPEPIVHPILDEEDAIKRIKPWLKKLHVVVIGPGLSRDENILNTIAELVNVCRDLKKPMIIDADGLYLISQRPDIVIDYPGLILTPNAMEFSRLAEAFLEKSIKPVSVVNISDIKNLAVTIGRNIVVLHKGARDVMVDGQPDSEVVSCEISGSARRCGGQGDVLTGALAVIWWWSINAGPSEFALSPAIIAAYAASRLTRETNAAAFETKHRGTLTSDMLQHVRPVFARLFEPHK